MSRPARIPGTTSKLRAVFVLPAIADELAPELKNGLAIRNAATTSGRCPHCHATGRLEGPDRVGFLHLTFHHEPWCSVLLDGDAA